MKKILFVLFSLFALSTFAQKSYVTIYVDLDVPTNNWVSARIGGDRPQGVYSSFNKSYDRMNEGQIINLLADYGYVVESITGIGDGVGSDQHSNVHTVLILMSKSTGNNGDSGIITTVGEDNNTNVEEIARYDMQGRPITKDVKGPQIIVYNNYTAKTVIVQ